MDKPGVTFQREHGSSRPDKLVLSEDPIGFDLPWNSLCIQSSMIERALGYTTQPPIPPVAQQIRQLLNSAPDRLHVRAGVRIVPPESVHVDKRTIEVEGIQFDVGPIVGKGLRKVQSMALFVCTAGLELDVWARALFDDDDAVAGYLVDVIGTETVERAADWLEHRLRETARTQNLGVTQRFSPGYCDWNVSEQHKLFSLLPQDFCGVTLTASAVMSPAKSVSGFIGIGLEAEKEEYVCKFCEMEHCYRRNTRYV